MLVYLILVGLSLFCSLVFSLLRQRRFFSHSRFRRLSRLNLIEYSGYGLKAFLLSLPLFLVGFLALYLIVWVFINVPPLWKGLTGVLLATLVVIILFRTHPGATLNWLFPPVGLNVRSDKRYVLLTFDTEEDWDGFKYYNSYLYITSGVFYQLVDGLNQRGVRATFYITPSLAAEMPEVLRYLEDRNQTIGAHLHPHNLINVSYPYPSPYRDTKGDELKYYGLDDKKRLLELAKTQIEDILGHKARLFRSGRHSCDYELEKWLKLRVLKQYLITREITL